MTSPLRKSAREDADRLLQALDPLPDPEERPAFLVMSGLPGSGKSHLAGELAARYPFAVVPVDRMRKTLFPNPAYTQAEHNRTFAAVHELIDRLLARKVSVLYDATNLKEEHRRALYEINDRNSARLFIVRTVAPDDVIRDRLSGGERWMSDADEEVFEMMRTEADPIRRPYIEVDTSKDIRPAVDKILTTLREVRV